MKINKTTLEVPVRKLFDSWTLADDSLVSVLGEEPGAALAAEILNDIARPGLLDQGWTPVTVSYRSDVPSDWIAKNISGDYKCFRHYWYFEKESDATLFLLRWS